MERLPVPRTSDRVILFGNSREGKSQLAKALLRAKPHVIVVDTKQNEDWSDVGEYVYGDAIYEKGPGRYIWRPGIEFITEMEPRNEFFKFVLGEPGKTNGNRVVYLDEIIQVAESANKYPRWLRLCVQTGGSANLGIWGTTQEPFSIPSFIASQANYIFAFHVGREESRDRIDRFTEEDVPWSELPTRSYRFVWKDEYGFHGPYHLDLRSRDAPTPTDYGREAGYRREVPDETTLSA